MNLIHCMSRRAHFRRASKDRKVLSGSHILHWKITLTLIVLCLHFQVDKSIINLTVGQHHGMVILIHGGAAHCAHQAALAAVSRGKAEGQTV